MPLTVSNETLTGAGTASSSGPGCLSDGTDTTSIQVDAFFFPVVTFTFDVTGTFTPGVLTLDVAAGVLVSGSAALRVNYRLLGGASTYVTDAGVTATVDTPGTFTTRSVIRHDRASGGASSLALDSTDCAAINGAGGLRAFCSILGFGATLRVYEATAFIFGTTGVASATAPPLQQRARLW